MSAMHWEARRRQSALERRTARDKERLLHISPEPTCSSSEANTAPQNTDQCPQCKSLKAGDRPGARIPDRFSSLQYTQQW